MTEETIKHWLEEMALIDQEEKSNSETFDVLEIIS